MDEENKTLNKESVMENIIAYNFDWDDNILIMPTMVLLYHKDTYEEIPVTTKEFARYRKNIGVKGKYQDYVVFGDKKGIADHPKYHSFSQFRDKRGQNIFLEQVKIALAGKSYGPSFGAFCASLRSKDTAKWTTIITARGHHPKKIYEALKYMQEVGYIEYLPPLKNIFPVSHKKFQGEAAKPSITKVEILSKILDEINEKSVKEKGKQITLGNGKDIGFSHVCGFSDDDPATFEHARDSLAKEFLSGRWKNIKIVLYYTGLSCGGPKELIFTESYQKGFRQINLKEKKELNIYEPDLTLSQ